MKNHVQILESCRRPLLTRTDQLTAAIALAIAAAQSISVSDLQRRIKIKFMQENRKLIHPEGNNLKQRV